MGRSPTGTTRWPPATTSRRAPRCRVTATPTWPSSAPGSRGCGPPFPAAGRPVAASRRARARDGGLRRAGPQRRLVRRRLRRPRRGRRANRGPGAVERMAREMHRSVDEVGEVVAAAGIDCGFHKGGALYFAVNDAQLRRVQHHRDDYARFGFGDAWDVLDASSRRRRSSTCPASAADLHASRRRRAPGPARGASPSRSSGSGDLRGDRSPGYRRPRSSDRPRNRPSRRGRARHGGLHRQHPRSGAGDPAARQLHGRHRTDRRRHVGADRSRRPRAVRAERLDARLRPAHGRRAHRVGRPRRRVDVGRPHPALADAGRPHREAPPDDRSAASSRRSRASGSRTTGAACSACRATCSPASGSTERAASRGRAATPGRASPPPTRPAGVSPTSSSASTATSCTSPGSATARPAGSPSRCGGSRSTPPSVAHITDAIDRRRG